MPTWCGLLDVLPRNYGDMVRPGDQGFAPKGESPFGAKGESPFGAKASGLGLGQLRLSTISWLALIALVATHLIDTLLYFYRR